MKDQENWMKEAIELACQNVMSNHGGPFGAVVVKDGVIIGTGKNEVTALNDPTAHAEVQAIREACRHLNSFQLTGCELYTSCEPCPMCLGAIYWSRPEKVYYASTKSDAAAIQFDDSFIYDEIATPMENRIIPMIRLVPETADLPFKIWMQNQDKTLY